MTTINTGPNNGRIPKEKEGETFKLKTTIEYYLKQYTQVQYTSVSTAISLRTTLGPLWTLLDAR